MLALASAAAASASPPNPIEAENAQPGTDLWLKAGVAPPAIEGYVTDRSILPESALELHVSTTPAARYRVEVYRLGWYGGSGGRRIACVPDCYGEEQGSPRPVPPIDAVTGEVRAGWPTTDRVPIGADAVSGYYVARLVLTSGPQAGRASRVFFVVRDPPERRSRVVVQVPVNTWEAYNGWGGKSLYSFNSTNGTAANRVSFDRPILPNEQSPLVWEIQLVRFLEREGYDLSYQTDADTDADPGSLLRHRLVVVSGHDEYWSKTMRDAFDAARDAGTNLAFMGANDAYWQVRYENGRQTLVGYKSLADPIADPTLKTALFRELGRPECELMGVEHLGAYRTSADPPVDYVVMGAAAADPWLAGTGLVPGMALPDLVGREWDAIPDYLPGECYKPGWVRFFHHEGPPGDADSLRYTAPSGARVFSAGSLQFSWALDDLGLRELAHPEPADPRMQQFVRNAMDDLTRPAPPTAVVPNWSGEAVDVAVARAADPRVYGAVVYRHEGQDAFDPAQDGTEVCRTAADSCSDEPLGHRFYRYGAVVEDAWTRSRPVLSDPLYVPDSQPEASLLGPRHARTGRPATYRVEASDRDGDPLDVSWRVDRTHLSGRAWSRRVCFGRVGRHVVAAVVEDGHGGRTVARTAVVVRGRPLFKAHGRARARRAAGSRAHRPSRSTA
jgi:N,N-dimethylformamidase beta subunit-like, C-terminal